MGGSKEVVSPDVSPDVSHPTVPASQCEGSACVDETMGVMVFELTKNRSLTIFGSWPLI